MPAPPHSDVEPGSGPRPPGEPAGPLYAWWKGDLLPDLPHLLGLTAEAATDYCLLADLAQLGVQDVMARVQAGHRPYIARLSGERVAYGWSATREASIGGLGIEFEVSAANRYLWDFATLPPWRGRGVYPRLLQMILARESPGSERFWIGHDLQNTASGRGITKAGFRRVADLCFLGQGRVGLAPTGAAERARAGAALLGVPLLGGGSVEES